MQRNSRARRSPHRRDQPQLSAGHENTGASIGDSAPSPIATLAPSFVQALPSLEGRPAAYSHEARGEMLYEFCAALVRAGIGTPEIWADCGGIAVSFAKSRHHEPHRRPERRSPGAKHRILLAGQRRGRHRTNHLSSASSQFQSAAAGADISRSARRLRRSKARPKDWARPSTGR